MPPVEHLLLVAFIVTGAFAVQTAIGFGAALVATPLIALLIGTKEAVALMLIFQCLAGSLLAEEWRRVSFRPFAVLIPSIAIGLTVGHYLDGYLSEGWVTLALGGYLLLFVATEIAAAYGTHTPKPNVVFSGVTSGALQTLFGTGGPPLAAYLQAQQLDKSGFRATVMAVFFFMNWLRIAIAIPSDAIPMSTLVFSVAAFPGFLTALWFGEWLHHVAPVKAFRTAVIVLLAASAMGLLYRAIGKI